MEEAMNKYENVDSWKTIMFLYNAALKEVGTKLEILKPFVSLGVCTSCASFTRTNKAITILMIPSTRQKAKMIGKVVC